MKERDNKRSEKFYEIINNQVDEIDFKSSQYNKTGYYFFWNKFWNLFQKEFSDDFDFKTPKNLGKEKVIFLKLETKQTKIKLLFVLSLVEGHIKDSPKNILLRLRDKQRINLQKSLKEYEFVFCFGFYADLKVKPVVIEDLEKNINFGNAICIGLTKEQILNCEEQLKLSFAINYNNICQFLNNKNESQKNPIKNIKINKSYWLIKINFLKQFVLNELNDSLYNNSLFDEEENYLLDNEEEERIKKNNYEKTYEEQLIKARRGQGKFRKDLLGFEKICPFTKIAMKELLIASHIKPWRKSEDPEKIDYNNGLLLTPMYDKLFDQGFISFTDNGELIISSKIWDKELLKKLNLKKGEKYNLKMTPKRKEYLEYHRENIFNSKK